MGSSASFAMADPGRKKSRWQFSWFENASLSGQLGENRKGVGGKEGRKERVRERDLRKEGGKEGGNLREEEGGMEGREERSVEGRREEERKERRGMEGKEGGEF
ncbi:hypothetical protein L345_12421, partial [Ophiophagus hannah]